MTKAKKDVVSDLDKLKKDFEDDIFGEVQEPTYIKPEDVAVDGLEATIGGKVYVVPSLTIRQLKRFHQRISDFDKMKTEAEKYEFMIFMILTNLKRNYPDATQDWLEENITPIDLKLIFSYMATGLTQSEIEEKKS